jgi:hypothetical protein
MLLLSLDREFTRNDVKKYNEEETIEGRGKCKIR